MSNSCSMSPMSPALAQNPFKNKCVAVVGRLNRSWWFNKLVIALRPAGLHGHFPFRSHSAAWPLAILLDTTRAAWALAGRINSAICCLAGRVVVSPRAGNQIFVSCVLCSCRGLVGGPVGLVLRSQQSNCSLTLVLSIFQRATCACLEVLSLPCSFFSYEFLENDVRNAVFAPY